VPGDREAPLQSFNNLSISMVSFRHLVSAGRRYFSSQQYSTRLALLDAIYSPFQKLQKCSPEYLALARSGKVWEDFFKPQNIEPYLAVQAKLQKFLDNIDELKIVFSRHADQLELINRTLVKEYAHQSTAIEGNPLAISDSAVIEDELEKQLFTNIGNLPSTSPQTLADLTLPSSDTLLPSKDTAQVAELRNHIVVSWYLTEIGLANPGTAGISLTDIMHISRLMLAGTAAEKLYTHGWGKRVALGEFRSSPISVKSNPMAIFPYPVEVPASMERYINWRDDCHSSSSLHPLILATHLFVYFCQIHPFPDGNGRVGRSLMADYMVRQRYMPVVFVNMDRDDYLRMVSDASNGKPEELCQAVVLTQAEMFHDKLKSALNGGRQTR
jgi:Fic family protein